MYDVVILGYEQSLLSADADLDYPVECATSIFYCIEPLYGWYCRVPQLTSSLLISG